MRWNSLFCAGLAWSLSGLFLGGSLPAAVKERPRLFPGERLFNDRPPFLTGVVLGRASGQYVAGDLLSVTFQAEEAAHLYLLYHQADGATVLLFPNVAERPALVPAKTRRELPGAGKGFRFRIQAPFGREFVQVLASKAALPELDQLIVDGQRSAPAVQQELLDALAERLLREPATWTEHRVPLETMAPPGPERLRQPARLPQRVALTIGIGRYAHPELAATHAEMTNSAKRMHAHLLRNGGIQPERARLLLDDQATRQQLEQSLKQWLPENSQPGDTVFIYFAGHAEQFAALDSAEPDGTDEALCPYDLQAGSPEATPTQQALQRRDSCILDDTLARWLQELSGRQVVLILDTCHTGPQSAGRLAARQWTDKQAGRLKDISQLNTIVLAACATETESRLAVSPDRTLWLTHCLSELFEKGQPVTVQDAFRYAQRRVKELGSESSTEFPPEPQLVDRALLPISLIP